MHQLWIWFAALSHQQHIPCCLSHAQSSWRFWLHTVCAVSGSRMFGVQEKGGKGGSSLESGSHQVLHEGTTWRVVDNISNSMCMHQKQILTQRVEHPIGCDDEAIIVVSYKYCTNDKIPYDATASTHPNTDQGPSSDEENANIEVPRGIFTPSRHYLGKAAGQSIKPLRNWKEGWQPEPKEEIREKSATTGIKQGERVGRTCQKCQRVKVYQFINDVQYKLTCISSKICIFGFGSVMTLLD